jgi:hypothetical protein
LSHARPSVNRAILEIGIPELNVILGRWWRPLSGADSGGGG